MTNASVTAMPPLSNGPVLDLLADAHKQCSRASASLVIELRRDHDFWRPGGETWDVEDFVAVAVRAAHYGRIVLAARGDQ
jgi:hypothetical protein